MMRKIWFYLLAVILAAAAVAAVVIATRTSKSHDDKASTASQTPIKKLAPKEACDIFSLADAKMLLGDSAKGGDNGQEPSSGDLAVSTCTYTQNTGSNAPTSTAKSATLVRREPKTPQGITSNHNEFGPLKPAQVEDVAGYGDSAYWDSPHGQLNILKNDVWYIISYGPTTPGDRTLDQAKQMADILINKM
jgi:hypothetical protein